MALVAERKDPKTGERAILAIGRLSKLHQTAEAEFAILVTDACQGHGFGAELLRRLVQIGRDEKLQRIVASILADNVADAARLAQDRLQAEAGRFGVPRGARSVQALRARAVRA